MQPRRTSTGAKSYLEKPHSFAGGCKTRGNQRLSGFQVGGLLTIEKNINPKDHHDQAELMTSLRSQRQKSPAIPVAYLMINDYLTGCTYIKMHTSV